MFEVCSRWLLIKHVCHGCPWFRQVLVLGITHWFARDRTAQTVIVANSESKQGFFSLAFLSGLYTLIRERSDGKESDFQKQGTQHAFVLLYMLKPTAFIKILLLHGQERG